MKTIPTNLQTHLQNEVTTLAYCWKIIFSDNSVLGFTSNDEDILFENILYQSKSGFTLDQYKNGLFDNSELTEIFGIIDSDLISENDIKSGLLDNAILEIFIINYKNPEDGRILIKKGKISEVKTAADSYVIIIKGLVDELDTNITEIYTPLCRARLGDNRCGINLSSYTYTGQVTSINNERIFFDTSRTEATGFFDKGVIKFTSGLNSGFSTEVGRSDSTKINLSIPFPNQINIGDQYIISAGCDKTFSTCKAKYSNAINFRGEPHIPGVNNIFKVL